MLSVGAIGSPARTRLRTYHGAATAQSTARTPATAVRRAPIAAAAHASAIANTGNSTRNDAFMPTKKPASTAETKSQSVRDSRMPTCSATTASNAIAPIGTSMYPKTE